MGILENCTDLWYLMSDFFYKYKCTNGYIDPKDPNYYSFKKGKYKFCIRRINDHDFRIKVIKQTKHTDINYLHCISLPAVEKTLINFYF